MVASCSPHGLGGAPRPDELRIAGTHRRRIRASGKLIGPPGSRLVEAVDCGPVTSGHRLNDGATFPERRLPISQRERDLVFGDLKYGRQRYRPGYSVTPSRALRLAPSHPWCIVIPWQHMTSERSPARGRYCCTNCNSSVVVDDDCDRLPPCGSCGSGQQPKYKDC